MSRVEREKQIKEAVDNSLDINLKPDFDGLIDEDIQERFIGSPVTWGDIINAQLIKTNKALIEALNKSNE